MRKERQPRGKRGSGIQKVVLPDEFKVEVAFGIAEAFCSDGQVVKFKDLPEWVRVALLAGKSAYYAGDGYGLTLEKAKLAADL